MLALISEAIKKCFEPAICFDAPYAKVMLDMAAKEVLKVICEPTREMIYGINEFDGKQQSIVDWYKLMIDAALK